MAEYIFEIDVGLYDEKTGECVFKPKVTGKLIRCKECKYFRPEYGVYNCLYHLSKVDKDGYCAWAERRTDE